MGHSSTPGHVDQETFAFYGPSSVQPISLGWSVGGRCGPGHLLCPPGRVGRTTDAEQRAQTSARVELVQSLDGSLNPRLVPQLHL